MRTAYLISTAVLFAFFRTLWGLFKKPQYRSLLIWVIILLLVGMIFYSQVEGWSWLDALYFSVITLSTVGYGDLSPDTAAAKIFTIVYIFLGISIPVGVTVAAGIYDFDAPLLPMVLITSRIFSL